jgi:transporter family-2 protein
VLVCVLHQISSLVVLQSQIIGCKKQLPLGKDSLGQYTKVIHVRSHLLVGGIFGAFIIYLVTKTMPKLGVATTLTIVVASEIIYELLIDAFITKQHQFDWLKLIGVILLLCGTFFIARK